MYSKIFPDRLKCRINSVVVLTARFVEVKAGLEEDIKLLRH